MIAPLKMMMCPAFVATVCAQTEFSTCLHDESRDRSVPVMVYQPEKVGDQTKVVIFNHGYDQNKNPESCRNYSYLTRFLAQQGYYVISIQHELASDPPLAMDGKLMESRMPNWKRGVENILFTITQFKKMKPELHWNQLVMMGHSNGGDMTMLMATHHAGLIAKAISLDHRRMVIPKVGTPRICTLRASDCEADPGVLPDPEEQQKNRMSIIQLGDIKHSDMSDRGTAAQHHTITSHVLEFLNE